MTRVCDLALAPTVVIVGGGFSGLLTAIHLLEQDPQVVVRLVEKAERFALGRAYAAADDQHLLNVRAANMSAFPSRPDHFNDWLAAHGGGEAFVSRARYGEYLQSLLRRAVGRDGHPGRLLLEQDEVVDIEPSDGRMIVHLAVGRRLTADGVVLATGLGAPSATGGLAALHPGRGFADPWSIDPSSAPSGDILLIGSGLTMVDVALALDRADRRFTAISRRGLAPQAHGVTTAAPIPVGDLTTPRQVMRSLRAHADQVGWRSAVDSIRPLTPAIWRRWSLTERSRFLRHARAWWDVHRHRMAPQVAARMEAMVADERLQVMAARIAGLEPFGDGVAARIRPRGDTEPISRTFSAVVDCTGLSGDLGGSPLMKRLQARGLVRPDALGLGLDVDNEFRVLRAGGTEVRGLYAVGPLTRSARWETVAVPDLRSQTEEVAANIVRELGHPPKDRTTRSHGPANLPLPT
jgi:uncharacterized NAD(P)/FAD-binding protein YdhS